MTSPLATYLAVKAYADCPKTNHTRNTYRLCNKVITLEFGMSKAVWMRIAAVLAL